MLSTQGCGIINDSTHKYILSWEAPDTSMVIVGPGAQVPVACGMESQGLFQGPLHVLVDPMSTVTIPGKGEPITMAGKLSFIVPEHAQTTTVPALSLTVVRSKTRVRFVPSHDPTASLASSSRQECTTPAAMPPSVIVSTRLQWTIIALALVVFFAIALLVTSILAAHRARKT